MTAVLMQIKRWDNGAVLFEGQFDSMRDCVLAALKSSVSLRSADLSSADLSSADLRSANLSYADLSSADLSSANLSSANLRSADLSSADLSSAKNSELAVAVTRILPEGVLIGWKKCSGGVIVKLRIPEAAPRSHAFGRKCRAGFVEVLEVIGAEIGVTSNHGPKTEYRVGETVKPDSWDEDFTSECNHGIHFFITRAEAEAYP
jgi:hypothetical protein